MEAAAGKAVDSIITAGGVWGALLFIAFVAIVFLFRSQTSLYERVLTERRDEVKEMTAALEKVTSNLITLSASQQQIGDAITAIKKSLEEINRTIAVGFSETKTQLAANKDGIDRIERLPRREHQ